MAKRSKNSSLNRDRRVIAAVACPYCGAPAGTLCHGVKYAPSNDALGFDNLMPNIPEVSIMLSRSESLNLIVGRKRNMYRAEAYQWHHEQDASREGVVDRVCARGATVEQALNLWANKAIAVWPSGKVHRVVAEYRELIAEQDDQK